jgi:hypothetical protein
LGDFKGYGLEWFHASREFFWCRSRVLPGLHSGYDANCIGELAVKKNSQQPDLL